MEQVEVLQIHILIIYGILEHSKLMVDMKYIMCS